MSVDQRGTSRRAVLDAIRKAGRIARIDLAHRTDMSQATVTTVTAEMIRQGLIEETSPENGPAAGGRGRPRVDLQLRGAAHYLAGVKIANSSISTVIMDFAGTMIGEHERELSKSQFGTDELTEILRETLIDAAAAAGLEFNALSGIGIGIAGIVDESRGLIHWSPTLTDRNIPFQDIVSSQLKKPVFVDNDANLVAVAEQHFGHGRGVSDFLVVTVESGVGLGIVINNEIYRGTRGCGSEFGHTKVQLNGALCRCGQRGCLEAYVADYALLREASVTSSHDPDERPEQRLQKLMHAAREGDAAAGQIVSRAGQMFAMGLANLVNIFDPELIILSGERMQSDFLYAEEVIESIRRSIVQVDVAPPEVVIHKWGNLMWAKGAAAYAIDQVTDISLRDFNENAA